MAEDNRPTKPTSMTSVAGVVEKKIEQPNPDEFKGEYKNIKDGFIYKHAQKDHPQDRTHKFVVEPVFDNERKNDDGTPVMIHSGLFWEGTKEEAKQQFERL